MNLKTTFFPRRFLRILSSPQSTCCFFGEFIGQAIDPAFPMTLTSSSFPFPNDLRGDCVHAGGMLDPAGESGLRLHACIPMCHIHQGCCNDTRIEWNSNIGANPPYLESYMSQGHQKIDGSSNTDKDVSKRLYASDVIAKLYPPRSVHLSSGSPCHLLTRGSAMPNDLPFKIPFLKSK